MIARGPWYPLLVAAAFVLAAWSESGVSVVVVWRPLLVVIAAAAVMVLVARLASRTWERAAALAMAGLVVLRAGSVLQAAVGLLLVGLSIGAVLLARRVLRRPIAIDDLTQTGNVVAGILLVVVIAGAGLNGSLGRAVTDLRHAVPLPARASTPMDVHDEPNIYLIMLDGYPRADTLARLFGFDNQEFLTALQDRGLHVSAASRSNYMYTALTFASMLHMEHLDRLETSNPNGDFRQLINQNPVFDELRSRGYTIVTTAAPWEDVAIRSSDYRCGDGPLTDFDVQLMRGSLLLPIMSTVLPDVLPSRHRSLVDGSLDCIEDAAAASIDGPRFTLAHIGSPHLPIVFDREGDAAELDYYAESARELPVTYDEFAPAYVDQLKYLNGRVLHAIDVIDTRDPRALIVVMSDHGSESLLEGRYAEEPDLNERFSNLFAARTPGHPQLFGDSPTPVNVFPRLLNAYLGLDIPEARDALFVSDPVRKSDLREIDPSELGD